MSNEIEEKLFEQIFGHTLIKLADKLINTINKEDQIIVKNIEKNKDKLFKKMNLVIGLSNQMIIVLIYQILLNLFQTLMKINQIWFELLLKKYN